MKPITSHPDADAEVTEAARYYESREPGLGLDLLAELEQALDQILTHPEASRKIGRRVRLKPFGGSLAICYTRFIQRPNTNRSIRPPEAATFLSAKAVREFIRTIKPRQFVKQMRGPRTGVLRAAPARRASSTTRQIVQNEGHESVDFVVGVLPGEDLVLALDVLAFHQFIPAVVNEESDALG